MSHLFAAGHRHQRARTINGPAPLCRTCNGPLISDALDAAVGKNLIFKIASVRALGDPYSVASADVSANRLSKAGEP